MTETNVSQVVRVHICVLVDGFLSSADAHIKKGFLNVLCFDVGLQGFEEFFFFIEWDGDAFSFPFGVLSVLHTDDHYSASVFELVVDVVSADSGVVNLFTLYAFLDGASVLVAFGAGDCAPVFLGLFGGIIYLSFVFEGQDFADSSGGEVGDDEECSLFWVRYASHYGDEFVFSGDVFSFEGSLSFPLGGFRHCLHLPSALRHTYVCRKGAFEAG